MVQILSGLHSVRRLSVNISVSGKVILLKGDNFFFNPTQSSTMMMVKFDDDDNNSVITESVGHLVPLIQSPRYSGLVFGPVPRGPYWASSNVVYSSHFG